MLGKNTVLMLSLLLAVGACVKKRPEVNAQGQNIDKLLSSASYNGLRCTLTTTDVERVDIPKNTQAEAIETDHPVISFLNVVDFSTDCPFLSENKIELEFRGEKNKTYNIVFKLEPNHLVAYKVVYESELSHYERPYSTQKEGKWYVPIGGFDVSYSNLELIRNSDNKDTNQKMIVPVRREDFKSAKYFLADLKSFKRFKTENKKDVFPISLFEGEWFFQRTVVRKRYGSASTIGFGTSGGVGPGGNFVDAGRIEFVVRANNIYGVSTNIDEKLKQQMLEAGDRLNAIIPVSIPGDLVNYKREELGDSFELSEVEIATEIKNGRYFKLEPLNIQATADRRSDFLSSLISFGTQKELKKILITKDYFELLIEKGDSGELVRYAFKKISEESTYKSRFAFQDDMRRFGYFTSQKQQIYDERTARWNDLEKRNFISRFDPQKDIVYHFSSMTKDEEWVRDIGREAINLWQQAFLKAGLKNRILLDESSDKEIGDIRYNLINIITDDTGDNGGFGPSFKDAASGEIISAVSNIYTAGDRNIFFRQLRAYVSEEIGYQPNFFSLGSNTAVSPMTQSLSAVVDKNFVTLNENGQFEPMEVFKWRSPETQSGFVRTPIVDNSSFVGKKILGPDGSLLEVEGFDHLYRLLTSKDAAMNSLYATNYLSGRGVLIGMTPNSLYSEIKNSQERIFDKAMVAFTKKRCPSVMDFISEYKESNTLPDTERENTALWPCVNQLMQLQALGNLMHEIGHNLGLRHNFMGSVDKRNFLRFGEYETKYISLDNPFTNKVASSSIMDYVPWPAYTQIAPGAFDLAALRFGYLGQVEIESDARPGEGEFVEVPNGTRILDYFDTKSNKMRTYKFCSDYNARALKTDPFCSVHDFGTTAVEMVKFAADSDIRRLGRSVLRIDKTGVPNVLTNGSSLGRMKEFYDEWRTIVATHVGQKRRYLQGINQEEYQEIVNDILNDPVNGERNKDLFKARNIFVNLALDFAFLPNKYCRVEDNNGGGEILLELSLIKQELQASSKQGRVSSCKDELVANFLSQNGYVLSDELGYFLEGGSFSLDPLRVLDVLDYTGTTILKLSAFNFLTTRMTPSYFNTAITNFAPNAMDEPDIRNVMLNLLATRALSGVFITKKDIELDDYAAEKLLGEEDILARLDESDTPYLNFKSETDIIRNMYSLYLEGLLVPNDPSASAQRTQPFVVQVTNNKQIIDTNPSSEFYEFQPGRYLFLSKESLIAKSMLDKIKQLNSLKELSVVANSQFDPRVYENNKANVYSSFEQLMFIDNKGTVGQLVTLFLTLRTTVEQLSKQQNLIPLANMLQSIFAPEMRFFTENVIPEHVTPELESANLTLSNELFQAMYELSVDANATPGGISEDEKNVILRIIGTDISQNAEVADLDLISSSEEVNGRIDAFIAEAQKNFDEQAAIGAEYLKSEDEYNAQSDLLFQLLLMFAGQ